MSSYLQSVRSFAERRARSLVAVGAFVGGVYALGTYAISTLAEAQKRMSDEKRDRENLKRRFAQNQDDVCFTVLALLPTLADQLWSSMDVEGLTAELQKSRVVATSAPLAAKEEIHHANSEMPSYAAAASTTKVEGDDFVEPQAEGIPVAPTSNDEASASTFLHGAAAARTSDEQPLSSSNDGVEGNAPNGSLSYDAGSEATDDAAASARPTLLKGNSSLDSISEPAPQPINPTARLTPSPQPSTSATPLRSPPSEQERATVQNSGINGHAGAVAQAIHANEARPYDLEGSAGKAPVVGGEQQPFASQQSQRSDAELEKAAMPSIADSKPTEHDGSEARRAHEASAAQAALSEEQRKADAAAEKKLKLELWNELKIAAISRTVTSLYALVLLTLQTSIQLNVLGRRAYLESVSSMFPLPPAPKKEGVPHRILLEPGGQGTGADGWGRFDDEHQDSDDEEESANDERAKKGAEETERLFLTFSWWLLHRGWKDLAQTVETAVKDVFGPLGLKAPLTHGEFIELLREVRSKVEYAERSSEREMKDSISELKSEPSAFSGVSSLRGGRGRRKNFFSILFPATEDEEIDVLLQAGAIDYAAPLSPSLRSLLDETHDLVSSRDFRSVMRLSLDRVFNVLDESLRPTFGVAPRDAPSNVVTSLEAPGGRFQELGEVDDEGKRIRLAALFPAVARQSQLAVHAVPNSYADDVAHLRAV
ncbi:Peroxisomal assembly protein PEX3 [Ceraceosorus bombacis]|uniref:Peroxisomal assembly protein PEX3 n=1 Tax=Ceraceosorus bombacis TaxID=401625 RepID=A0A0P1BLU7_9BASI|nr:Peroxisomal assembly protein PEX3 [Ceraceosorus bombacis]